ncbi:MAG: type II toxin-antitoxin system RelE/ParE family toxin [Spirochaetaceae bacterium]|jgi:hypothetical protein|nr:type II toxin-antitoxin system RelE/ParE family toxin [Spirochaetaceae bacterium]
MVEPIIVIETPSFLRDCKDLLDDDEREALVAFLAYKPKAGDVIVGTGGIRKVRWARESEGKSGGFRVIYYYHSNEIPLFALNVFAKNEKANVTKAERNELKKLSSMLKDTYKPKGKKK